MSALRSKVSDFYRRYERQSDVCFFLSGFLFDVFTLGRTSECLFIVFYQKLLGFCIFDFCQPCARSVDSK